MEYLHENSSIWVRLKYIQKYWVKEPQWFQLSCACSWASIVTSRWPLAGWIRREVLTADRGKSSVSGIWMSGYTRSMKENEAWGDEDLKHPLEISIFNGWVEEKKPRKKLSHKHGRKNRRVTTKLREEKQCQEWAVVSSVCHRVIKWHRKVFIGFVRRLLMTSAWAILVKWWGQHVKDTF